MKIITALWLAIWLTPPVSGQHSATYKVNQIMTFSYPVESTGIIDLSATPSLPQTKGAVRVVRGSIAINIDVLVDHLPPAQNLGENLNAYVVWLISPDGEVRNVGELTLNGDSGILHTTTNWGAFGIFVTAEPNNCETCPGAVVLLNDACVGGVQPERFATIVCPNPSNRCGND